MTVARLRSASSVQRYVSLLAFAAALAFAFTLPWERGVVVPGVGSLGRLVGLAALSVTMLMLFDGTSVRFRRPPIFLALAGGFTVWALASVWWSVAPDATLDRAVTYAQLLAMSWVLWQVSNDQSRSRSLLQAYVLGGYVMVVGLVAAYIASSADGFVRYAAFAENQNYLAQRLVLGLPMAWYLTQKSNNRVLRWVNALFIPACLLAVGLSASRGAFVMAAVALLVVPMTLRHMPQVRRVGLVLVMVVGFVTVLSLAPVENVTRLAETPDAIATFDFTRRERIWQVGLEAYLAPSASWAVGMGAGTFGAVVAPTFGGPVSSHNAYVSVLVELGPIGLALFLAMIVVPMIPVLKQPPLERWGHLSLWAALLVAMMSSNWDYERVTWFVLTVIVLHRAFVFRAREDPPRAWPRTDDA